MQWFCDFHKVQRDDDIIIDKTLEELTVEYMTECIKADKEYYERIMNNGEDSYERWLKEQMGEEYQSTEENVQTMLKEQERYSEQLQEQFPDEVKTDFTKILQGD